MVDQNHRILVVDDDEHIHLSLQVLLEPEFGDITCLKDPNKILDTLKKQSFDVILLDMNYKQGETSGEEGMTWLKKILDFDSELNELIITAYGDLSIAVNALKNGAIDFIVKPCNIEKLLATINLSFKLSSNKKAVKQLNSKQKYSIKIL